MIPALCWVLPGPWGQLWVGSVGAGSSCPPPHPPPCRAAKEISHQVLLWKQGEQPGFWQPAWSLASAGVTHRHPMSWGSSTSTLWGMPVGSCILWDPVMLLRAQLAAPCLGGTCCPPALPREHINVFSMYICTMGLLRSPESRLEGTAKRWVSPRAVPWVWGAGRGSGGNL